jgi:ketosteroid isomerase-like protein
VATNKFMSLLVLIPLVIGFPAVTTARARKADSSGKQGATKPQSTANGSTMSDNETNAKVILDLFSAVERYDARQQFALYQPNVEFHWPPSLYGGAHPSWDDTWLPLQPTWAERKMDPRLVAASKDEVVVLWHQKGVSPAGDRFEGEVLGLYQMREGKLTRAQMFYFDTVAVTSFLAKAMTPELQQRTQTVIGQLNHLPFGRQEIVGKAYGELLMLSPDRREGMLNSEKFKSQLSDDDRHLLKKMFELSASHNEESAKRPSTSKPF